VHGLRARGAASFTLTQTDVFLRRDNMNVRKTNIRMVHGLITATVVAAVVVLWSANARLSAKPPGNESVHFVVTTPLFDADGTPIARLGGGAFRESERRREPAVTSDQVGLLG
jgi:hypothetical protein